MYVEGFIIPVKTARKAEYLAMARTAADLFREYGATRVVETWGADVPVGEETSFPRAVALEDDETAVLAWIEWPDKATRDAGSKRVFDDPRMTDPTTSGVIAGRRLIYGGFTAILDT